MDSRDIREEPQEVAGKKYLEEIYAKQRVLIDHYVGIEGLPPYPVDVNIKENQNLLKDFTSRVIEELAEGYEAFTLLEEITRNSKFWSGNFSDEAYTMALNHLQNANEEQADALHFMVELLIYANILPEDIDDYVTSVTSFSIPADTDIISKCMILGKTLRGMSNELLPILQQHMVSVLKPLENGEYKPEEEINFGLLQGGMHISKTTLQNHKPLLWDITQHLNMSRNFLKNKPWKQSEVMTNEEKYQEQLVLAFIKLMGYFEYLGLNSDDVYYLYFKKNMVNQFRIQSKY